MPANNLWGTIPTNINPAAAGTAAWQMTAKQQQNAMQQLNINMQRPHNPPAPSLRSPGGVHPQIMMPYMQQQPQSQPMQGKPPPPPYMLQQQQRGLAGPMSPAAFQPQPPPPSAHHDHMANDLMATLNSRNVQVLTKKKHFFVYRKNNLKC